ncbi:unnamed protein product, partial [Owenia fusiformis]
LDVYVLVHIADLQTGVQPGPLLKDICMASTGLLIFGFTFFYGGMTVKSWGVYKLFSQQRTESVKEVWLVFIFFLLVVADVVIIAVWFAIDPLHPITRELSSTIYVNEERILPLFRFCCCSLHEFVDQYCIGCYLVLDSN